MRSESDRLAVLELYAQTVGDIDAANLPQLQPQYLVTRQTVQVGAVWLPRVGTVQPDANGQRQLVLPLQLRPRQALMSCVRMNWMGVLCGEAGAGKTSLVRLLARLTGHRLQVSPAQQHTAASRVALDARTVFLELALLCIASHGQCSAQLAVRF